MIPLTIQALQEFIALCVQSRPKWIIPIPSEGAAMISLALDQALSYESRIVYADRLDQCDPGWFKSRDVVLLDFSVLHGKMMSFVANQLLSYGANVIRSAFVVHNECPEDAIPDRYITKASGDDYIELKDQFIELCLQHPHPYDTDHWDAKFRLDPFDLERFIEATSQFGDLHIVSEPDDAILRLTLELDDLFPSPNLDLPNKAQVDSVRKIRIYADPKTRSVSAVGLHFPSLPIESDPGKHRCPVIDSRLSICRMLEKRGRVPKGRDCFDACSFYSNIFLVRAFIEALCRELGNVRIEQIVDRATQTSFRALYPMLADDLWPAVEEFFDNTDLGNSPGIWGINKHLPMRAHERAVRSNSYVNSYVSAAVYSGWNQAVLNQEVGEPEAFENCGTSFHELCNLIGPRLSRQSISHAMDVLLDLGVIRPVVTSKHSVKNTVQRPMWVRAYRPAGEQMTRVLRELYRIRSANLGADRPRATTNPESHAS